MPRTPLPETRLSPIFVIADDDRDAMDRMVRKLPAEWTFVQVSEARLVTQYAQRFATTAVFLADPIDYPRGGARRLLQDLLDAPGKPVVILAEECGSDGVASWKSMGAVDCLPHPTRSGQRIDKVRKKMLEIALSAAPSDKGAPT